MMKRNMIEEFQDVFIDGGSTLRPMICLPAETNVVLEATPIRISTARRLAYAFRDETKKELDIMVQQGVIKPVGNIATT